MKSFASSLLLACVWSILAACSPAPESPSADSPPAVDAKSFVPLTDNLSLTVPTAGWTVAPAEAYLVGAEIWTLYQLTPPAGMAAQVIERATCSFSFEGPADTPIKQLVFGKTWKWNSNPELRFVNDPAEISDVLKTARRLD